MMAQQVFSEPAVPDERVMLRGETRWQFLLRSTWARATETRAFYNEALAVLPVECRKPTWDALRAGRTENATFEMVVGRFLQVRGALALDHEPEQGGRRVDWRAVFPDGLLHVEAMVPLYNADSVETASRQERLLAVIEERLPDGWWLMPFDLPTLPGDAPLHPFREVAEELIGQIPPAASVPEGASIYLIGHLPEGRIHFTAHRASGPGGLGGGAAISYVDDSEEVIRDAWHHPRKRKQGRSVPSPALLAMAGGFTGADLQAFEMALFGRDIRFGGPPDGAMAVDRNPPWAGVLAFPEVSPAGATDPVLFVAPAYAGPFPAAVDRLEVRRLVPGGLAIQEARDRDVLAGIRWAQP